jgi:hypothetical protein
MGPKSISFYQGGSAQAGMPFRKKRGFDLLGIRFQNFGSNAFLSDENGIDQFLVVELAGMIREQLVLDQVGRGLIGPDHGDFALPHGVVFGSFNESVGIAHMIGMKKKFRDGGHLPQDIRIDRHVP